jgi:hypothetical protein
MRNPAFSNALRSGAPVVTTIQPWLSASGGASAANAQAMAATNNPANRDARIIITCC